MKNFIICLVIMLTISTSNVFASVFEGGVQKDHLVGASKVIDSATNTPSSGAKITLPLENYTTYSDSDGKFKLDANIKGPTVISVEKDGYKPFSLTLGQSATSKPMTLGIEKSTPKDITIDTHMFHLGDNSYSDKSANARDFQVKSVGPYYSKSIKIPTINQGTKVSLVIGSIIGVDTKMAKDMGQNKVANAFASPPEIYFNGNKIAEIQLNGDGQKIKIPYNLIKQNQSNEITVKTGRNLMQTAYVDYDDIEIMNLSIETN